VADFRINNISSYIPAIGFLVSSEQDRARIALPHDQVIELNWRRCEGFGLAKNYVRIYPIPCF
jgi:hypothetical protein